MDVGDVVVDGRSGRSYYFVQWDDARGLARLSSANGQLLATWEEMVTYFRKAEIAYDRSR